MKRILSLVVLTLVIIISAYARPPAPEWILGRWQANDGRIWEWSPTANSDDEGILTIYENEKVICTWNWYWKGNDTYHIERNRNELESFVISERGNNEFFIQSFKDANTYWVLKRLGEQREEWVIGP